VEKEELAAVIGRYLDEHTVLNLATAGRDGAHAASVFYARLDFNLYWFSDPQTRHSMDIHRGLGCAGTVTDNAADYRDIQGLQLNGVAQVLTDDAEIKAGIDALVGRHDFLKEFMSGDGAGLMEKVSIYRFQPLCITWIDNSVSFGFKQSLDFNN